MDSITKKNTNQYNVHATEWQEAMSENVGHKYLEKPAMDTMLPKSLEGETVLSIGVGSGDELEGIIKRNPERIIAIDVSKELLKIASKRFPPVEFQEMDMMDMSFKDESFDYIYSSLVFHYANDWSVLLKEVNRVLRKGGEVLFSTDNPDYWSQKPKTGNTHTNQRGVTLKEHTYLLPGDVEIIFYNHQSKEALREDIEHAGFQIKTFFSPKVVDCEVAPEESERYLELKEKNPIIPLFLIIKVTKQ